MATDPGQDFGTTRCKTAVFDASGKPVIVPNARGDDLTPTALYIPKSGPPLIGTDALEQGVVDPSGLVRHFKRFLGTGKNLLPDRGTLLPADAVHQFVLVWKADAEQRLGFPIVEAIVTCPANFRDDQKRDLLDGYERAGIKVKRLLAEPTAAALAYALDKDASGQRIMIFDLGGGTFDVTIVEVGVGEFKALATDGVRELGGLDFSQKLRELVQKCLPKSRRALDPLTEYDLNERIERAKISLATQAETPIIVGQQVIQVTQAEYHAAVDPLIEQALAACDAALKTANLTYADIDSVIFVGGASRPAYIRERVARHTGRPVKCDIDPDKAIAYGAACAARACLTDEGRKASIRGQAIPDLKVRISEVTAHGVGCAVSEKAGLQSQLVNAVLIPKGSPIPCQRVQRFRLEHDQQRAAQVEILQGDDNAPYDQCLVIGELTLDNLPPDPQRSERIQVTYAIDANGMVTATAADQISGQSQTTSFEYRQGLASTPNPKRK